MFSFDDYRKIITLIQESGRTATYAEAMTRDDFILMRHDVEYSVERAFALSEVETEMGFSSYFFFQWTNNSYNILSKKNRDLLTIMHEKGQHIGLHFALNGMTDMELVRERIRQEIAMLSNMLGFQVDTFSIHRPSKEVLRENIKFSDILNAYQDEFFTFDPEAGPDSTPEVKYLSDANHIWRYGYPDEETIRSHRKIQILAHPFAWTKEGYDNKENFKTLLEEKYAELFDSVDRECKDFGEYREELKKVPMTYKTENDR